MSSSRQGFLRLIDPSAGVLRRALNVWPPYLGAGVRVTRISRDFREVDVTLKLGLLNRNYFGTQFGGSIYAMADPFFALMLMRNLGPEHVVWDKEGSVRYVKPGRGDVFARFRLTRAAVDRVRKATASGAKHEPTFHVRITDREGEVVAEVTKTLHVRRRPAAPAGGARTARAGSKSRKGLR